MKIPITITVLYFIGLVYCDESLEKALNEIRRRQREMPPSNFYSKQNYLIGDGQPEDIGYGYQKTMNLGSFFENLPIPESQLGSHDNLDPKAVQKLIFDYLEQHSDDDYGNYDKRSIFRERGDTDSPDELQRLYQRQANYGPEDEPSIERVYGEAVSHRSPFRERYKGENAEQRLKNAYAVVKNYAGLVQPRQRFGNSNDDEYLQVLNSVWDKYKGEEDPESISSSEVEELLEYLNNGKDDDRRKRQFDPYEASFTYPLIPWTKRAVENTYPEPEPLFYTEDIPGFDDRYALANIKKRYIIKKRSPAFFNEQSELHRHKKNLIKQRQTDPKVTEQLNNIFASPSSINQDHSTTTSTTTTPPKVTTKKYDKINIKKKESGQKEISSGSSLHDTSNVKLKKSIDWSQYFGIDRRRKKSLDNDIESEMNEIYANAYGMEQERKIVEEIESEIGELSEKIKFLQEMILDTAVKLAGANQGVHDRREIEEVKLRLISLLNAAFGLGKMRYALEQYDGRQTDGKTILKDLEKFKQIYENYKYAFTHMDKHLNHHDNNSYAKDRTEFFEKPKRVGVKKEKAEYDEKSSDTKIVKKSASPNNGLHPHWL